MLRTVFCKTEFIRHTFFLLQQVKIRNSFENQVAFISVVYEKCTM